MPIDAAHHPRAYNRIAVLFGGWTAEREVSLATGRPCADALRAEGYDVTEIDVDRDVAARLADLKPDAVFNALHGNFGEDGCIQGVLETLEIPYTHSGVLASALAMHKERAKVVMAAAGVPVAKSRIVPTEDLERGDPMPRPYVLKPVAEGSSVAVFIVKDGTNIDPASIAADPKLRDYTWMAEEYVAGRELTCAVMDDRNGLRGTPGLKPLGVTEIKPRGGLDFYDYEAKYAAGGSDHEIPATLKPDLYRDIEKLAVAAHQALGCRGVSRADFRLDERADGTQQLVCLEVNTQPGMTATSLVPEQAAHCGMSFGELVSWIVEDASLGR